MMSSPPGTDLLVRERLRSQRLTGTPFADPVAAVRWFGAVQCQDFAAALWGVGQRCAASTDSSIRRLFDAGAIVRTHVLRPTWHFVAAEDLRWMLALTAPRVHVSNGPHYRRHELDERGLRTAAGVITGALSGGAQLTRPELAEELTRKGISVEGLRLSLIVMWCELEALICSGAMRGRQHTYALVADRITETLTLEPDEALGELATRYFSSHGPALLADFVWWSGLKVSEARRAIEVAGERLRIQTFGELTYFSAAAPETTPTAAGVLLLPNFDEYVVAYRDRSALLPAAAEGSVPIDSHVVLVDGRLAGTWKRSLSARKVMVSVNGCDGGALMAQVARFGKFLNVPVELRSNSLRWNVTQARME